MRNLSKGVVMSAEKEIVNYWLNKKGFFTINNIKANSNRDAGIIALNLRKGIGNEAFHIEVSCSITNNISETTNLSKSISEVVEDKFYDAKIKDLVPEFLQENQIKKIMVIGAVPKSRKTEIIKEFNSKGVEVIEFENILYDVLGQLDTQYYKNDVIRTLQLAKFLLLSEPAKLAKLAVNDAFGSNSKKELLSSILADEGIVAEFKKTSSERLGEILHNVLNKKARKSFLNLLIEQENSIKAANKARRTRRVNESLQNFFV